MAAQPHCRHLGTLRCMGEDSWWGLGFLYSRLARAVWRRVGCEGILRWEEIGPVTIGRVWKTQPHRVSHDKKSETPHGTKRHTERACALSPGWCQTPHSSLRGLLSLAHPLAVVSPPASLFPEPLASLSTTISPSLFSSALPTPPPAPPGIELTQSLAPGTKPLPTRCSVKHSLPLVTVSSASTAVRYGGGV